jgi:hypothetical protein
MAEELNVPEQPDGITSDSFDLPTPDAAAKRVGEYLEWWGDGLIDTLGPNARHDATPLYARDLQALVNSVRDMSWRVVYLEARDAERDLLLWLHAEAVWQRDVAHRIVERMETGHVEFGGPGGERIHPDWCRECRVSKLQAAIADIDAHATPIGLLDERDPDGSPHHYALTVGALHRALGLAYTAEPCESERARLRVEVERLRREVEFEANADHTLHMVFGFDNPVRPCACITDEQAATLAPGFSRPVCTVHPGGTE